MASCCGKGSHATLITLNLYVNTSFFVNGGGIQEALVNKAFPLLFTNFRTLKHIQSLRLRIYILNPNEVA